MDTILKKILLAIASFLVLGGTGIFFFGHSKQGDEYFLTEKAAIRDLKKTVVVTGTVAPIQTVEVGAQVSGQIESIHVKLGQFVLKDSLIATIDSTTQKNDLETQKAQLDTYLARYESCKITLRIAQRKYNREYELRRQDATSKEKFENAEDALAKAKADMTEVESLIKQTQIAVNTAEANLGYTAISAPISGVVVAIPVEVGQTVNANQTTPTIVKIADLSKMEIKMKISEGDITQISPGMVVSFSILSASDKHYQGVIATIDPGDTNLTDSIEESSASGEKSAIYYYARMLVDNSEGMLRGAMTTQCEIDVASADRVIVVPTVSIHDRNGEKYVILLKHNKQEERAVKIGISDITHTQILSGLEGGEDVVTAHMTDMEIQENINRF